MLSFHLPLGKKFGVIQFKYNLKRKVKVIEIFEKNGHLLVRAYRRHLRRMPMVSKIKDGLFLGNAESSNDPEFLENNKISNLVNLAGREIPNVWASHGLVYLTFLWEDRPDFKLFGDSIVVEDGRHPPPLTEIVDFIDESLRHGISVLLFSTRGQSRCVVAACAYLMCKFKWGFEKAFELISSKKPDVAPNKGFVQQLFALDRALLTHWGGLRPSGGDTKILYSPPSGPNSNPVNSSLHGLTLSLSTNDVLRWKGWDATYLARILPGASPESRPDKELSSILCAHNAAELNESDDDELLIVCSFINSKKASRTFWATVPKASSHKRRVTFSVGNQLSKILDINTTPTVTFSQPRGILKGRRSESKAGFERASVIRQTSDYASLHSIPLNVGSNGALSTGDLYGFVGMRCEGPSSLSGEASVEKPKSRSSIHSEKSMTAEQRLLEVVQSMSVRGVSQVRSEVRKNEMAEPKFTENFDSKSSEVHAKARQDKGIEWERRADSEKESKEVDTAPSLYDLAYKDIVVSAAPRAMFGSNGGRFFYPPKSVGADDDPLAAFSMLQQQGGVLRARNDLGVANVRQPNLSNDRGREREQGKNSRRGVGGVCTKPVAGSVLGISPNMKDRKRPSTPSIISNYSLASSNASSGVRGAAASVPDSRHGRGWR